tara:strand:+ start:643 stop:1887 length:1245 start_codon:yes stop_codon:yes gene_type:complete
MSANQEQQKMVETALTGLATTQEEASRNRAKSMLSLRSLQEPVDLTVEKEPSDEEVVKGMLSKMFEMNLENPDTQEGILLSISNKNKGVMAKASQFTSAKLDARMGDLKGSEEGNALFNEMTSLNKTLREIHPSKFDMTETFFQKYLPFVASPVRKYFDQFRTTKSVIDETRGKLEKSIADQRVDLNILRQDKKQLAAISIEIKKAIAFNTILKEEIEMQTHSNLDLSDSVREFLEAQVLFNVTREIQGLQELLTVNMQGQQAFEMLLRTGNDLIDAAERCINVSVNALTIAAVIAHVVAGQKKMLEGIQSVNKTAEASIEWNAKQLNTVVKEVGQAAVQTNLDVALLENAISMSVQAIEDDINFRRESLPMMNENVSRLTAATAKAEESTKKLEKSRNFKENYDRQAAELFNI